MQKRIPDASFHVFSDDPTEARFLLEDALKDSPVSFESGSERADSDLQSLSAMSRMDGMITANSSLSWWGAWLSNAPNVVVPERWFADGRRHALYVPRWKTL
jgi:hypothetical protein